MYVFSGSIDGNNQLIIKGRFQQKQIEHVLRAYISKYRFKVEKSNAKIVFWVIVKISS